MPAFNPTSTETTFQRELIPEGPHAARCARVIEIGEQESKAHPEYGIKNKAVIVFSIPAVLMKFKDEEKQAFISNPFGIPMTNHEKSSMKQYTRALSPVEGNLGGFLEQTCQVYIKHQPSKTSDNTVQKIDSVSPLLPGTPVGDLDTEPFWFQWDKPDPVLYALIPEFQQQMISEAVNYSGSLVEQMVIALGDDSANSNLPM